MTVILVLVTFLLFALLDYVLSRGKVPATAGEAVPQPIPSDLDYVDGFYTPETVRYHAGHGWLQRERPNVARVGIDEFAAALAGKVDKIEAPKPGQWIRQGQRALSFFRKGEKTEMVSPIEGEVVAVNAEALKDPTVVRNDPYGKGWLLLVHVPDEESTWRNLVPFDMVRSWMRNSVERLYGLQPAFAAVAADGGRPGEDLLEGIPGASWKQVTGEFFLTGPDPSGCEIAQHS